MVRWQPGETKAPATNPTQQKGAFRVFERLICVVFRHATSETPVVLRDEDELSLWVGRVARTNALLEYDLGNVRRILNGVPHATGVGVDQLAGDCRVLLKKSRATPEVVTAGLSALDGARKANAGRNRVVHDLWLAKAHDGGDATWQSFRLTSGRIDPDIAVVIVSLQVVVDTHEMLCRARARVSGLFMALNELQGREATNRNGRPIAPNMSRYLAMMHDQFRLHDNGDIELTVGGESCNAT